MKLRQTIIGAFVLFALMVTSAHAVQKMKRIQGPTTYAVSSGTASTGTLVAATGCSKVMLGVFLKVSNGSAPIQPYAEVASTSTGTAYRTANLGGMTGVSKWYWRELTAPASPYIRPYFNYSTGFTGTTELWCVYDNGAQ